MTNQPSRQINNMLNNPQPSSTIVTATAGGGGGGGESSPSPLSEGASANTSSYNNYQMMNAPNGGGAMGGNQMNPGLVQNANYNPNGGYIVGRIPANKHDNRKLFVGGLPNEGSFWLHLFCCSLFVVMFMVLIVVVYGIDCCF